MPVRYRSVSLPEDLVADLDTAVAEGVLRRFAVRSKPQAIEYAVRRLLEEANVGQGAA